MTVPREVENFDPLIVRYSDDAISVGRFSSPNGPGVPPLSPAPLWPSSSAGQIWAWKVMLSLPMKYTHCAAGSFHQARQASGSPLRRAHSTEAEKYPITASNHT